MRSCLEQPVDVELSLFKQWINVAKRGVISSIMLEDTGIFDEFVTIPNLRKEKKNNNLKLLVKNYSLFCNIISTFFLVKKLSGFAIEC